MNSKQIIAEAVRRSQGRKLPIGSPAAHLDDPVTRELVAYEEDDKIAVLSWGGVTKRWPVGEIFDKHSEGRSNSNPNFGDTSGYRVRR